MSLDFTYIFVDVSGIWGCHQPLIWHILKPFIPKDNLWFVMVCLKACWAPIEYCGAQSWAIEVDGRVAGVDPQGGYAHVAFSDAESMKKALHLNGTKVGKKAWAPGLYWIFSWVDCHPTGVRTTSIMSGAWNWHFRLKIGQILWKTGAFPPLCHDMPWFPVSFFFLIDSMLKPDMLTQISDVLHLLDAVVQGRYLEDRSCQKARRTGRRKECDERGDRGKELLPEMGAMANGVAGCGRFWL